ncbi:MAG: hypothetical protein WD638_06715 [Nitriliruptoraceae bacterium]
MATLSSVRTFLPVAGEPVELEAAFSGDPGRWLPDARHAGEDVWMVRTRGAQFTRTVRARVGPAWRAGATLWRSLSWDPIAEQRDGAQSDHWLPSLDGEIGLHLHGGRSTLVLDARYRPPGGAIGAALDQVVLHRVAQNTFSRLLAESASRLVAEAQLLERTDPESDDSPEDAPSD